MRRCLRERRRRGMGWLMPVCDGRSGHHWLRLRRTELLQKTIPFVESLKHRRNWLVARSGSWCAPRHLVSDTSRRQIVHKRTDTGCKRRHLAMMHAAIGRRRAGSS